MYRISNGGRGHDLTVKIITKPTDPVAQEVLEALVLGVVLAAWPESEPVVMSAVFRQAAGHANRVVYVAVHSRTYFQSRVAHSCSDSRSLIVTREQISAGAPYSADELLARLTSIPPCVLAIGVSAVSASYMAELWGLLQDSSLFEPAATYELTSDSERRPPTEHGWQGTH